MKILSFSFELFGFVVLEICRSDFFPFLKEESVDLVLFRGTNLPIRFGFDVLSVESDF